MLEGSKEIIPREDRQCTECNSRNVHMHSWTDDRRARRYRCADCGQTMVAPFGRKEPPEHKSEIPPHSRYVITSAQNAAEVYVPFFNALKTYCDHNSAELIVVPIRYRNPTSVFTDKERGYDWWAKETQGYRYEGRFDLNPNVQLLADIKTQPTAVSPLAGFETITGAKSGIIAHPKLELRCIPTPHHKLPKVMVTTGACTKPDYTDTKTGKKGEFHHTLGALVVEIDGNKFHFRQINAMRDGSFYDLNKRYTSKAVTTAKRIEAIVMGDTHVDFVDPNVVDATFGSMVPFLKPKYLVWHDLLDFFSKSHHHRQDPFRGIAKREAEKDIVLDEIIRAVEFIDRYTPKDTIGILVPSNHPDALARWIKETDWRSDPTNATTYLETALHMANGTELTPNGTFVPDPFHFWVRRLSKKLSQYRLFDRDDSFRIKDIEVCLHGDRGAGGSRGSLAGISKIGVKTIIGHLHTPGIRDGGYQVGTSSRLKLDYTSGPSSWLHTHCLIYPNGKRSLVSIIGDKWRLE